MFTECDVPEFCNVVDRKARKQHKCCECRAPIRIGETYVNCTGKWDGKVDTFRQHMHCADACRYIRDHDMNDDGGCIPFGGLFDWYGEVYYRRELPKEFRDLMAKVLNGYRHRKS